jgi:hypothetical protein
MHWKKNDWLFLGCHKKSSILFSILVFFAPVLQAQNAASPAQVKAALVYNFMKYAEWPADPGRGPLTLCIAYADHQVEAAFAAVNGRTIDTRQVQVHSLLNGENTAQCHLIYIHDGKAREMLQELSTKQIHLLTIGDHEDFVDVGGAIGLVEQNGRLQFKVNLDVIKRGNYRISSQLLKLAVNTR